MREERQRNRRAGLSLQGLRPGIRQVAVGVSRTQGPPQPQHPGHANVASGKSICGCLGQHQTQPMQSPQNPGLPHRVVLPRNQAGAGTMVAA